MQEERKKILEMLAEGTISVEEAEVLFDTLLEKEEEEVRKKGFGEKFKEDFKQAREEFLKAKENFKKQLEKLNLEEKARIGFKKASSTLNEINEDIKAFGNKVKVTITKKERED
ncbi:MAG TPA: hypothetical protein GX692_00905 [Acholeplasmataceae bacterium]|jgi:HEAT repeat protein|nr:hypothetical protein [Acholeplasmataceae bacterium]